MSDSPKYWFPAKRHGWGWSVPITWQGWLVLATYLTCLGLLVHFIPPARQTAGFAAGVLVLTALLLAICRLEGEPLHWRWDR